MYSLVNADYNMYETGKTENAEAMHPVTMLKRKGYEKPTPVLWSCDAKRDHSMLYSMQNADAAAMLMRAQK